MYVSYSTNIRKYYVISYNIQQEGNAGTSSGRFQTQQISENIMSNPIIFKKSAKEALAQVRFVLNKYPKISCNILRFKRTLFYCDVTLTH